MTTPNAPSPRFDPLHTASDLMNALGGLAMGGSVLLGGLLVICAMLARIPEVLFAACGFFSVVFIIGSLVRSASAAMKGRYTYNACRRAALFAFVLSPLGLVVGIYTLVRLHDANVRDSFTS
ncbi:MAG: hypothetical protein QM817_26175 [Archangium sp.]